MCGMEQIITHFICNKPDSSAYASYQDSHGLTWKKQSIN